VGTILDYRARFKMGLPDAYAQAHFGQGVAAVQAHAQLGGGVVQHPLVKAVAV
jgi:hypothetical protein